MCTVRVGTEAMFLVRRWFPMDETKTGCEAIPTKMPSQFLALVLFTFTVKTRTGCNN